MVNSKKILRTMLPVLLAVLLSSLILSWLYYHDNKYTHKGTQAISGVLMLNEQAVREEQVFYLTRGWRFYPGKLLTPADFADGKTPDAYMQATAANLFKGVIGTAMILLTHFTSKKLTGKGAW